MTTARAIEALRRQTGLSQADFAAKLETTITTISRWENSKVEPSREALKKLAAIAAEAGQDSLRDFFEAQLRASIAARISRLPSAGTGRHIPVADLKRWSDQQRVLSFLLKGLAEVLRKANPDLLRMLTELLKEEAECDSDTLRQALFGMARRLETIHNDLEVYIRGGRPPERETTPTMRRLLSELETHDRKENQ